MKKIENGVDFELSQIEPSPKKKENIYEISSNYQSLINEIEMMEGEITPEMASKLEITEAQLQSKSMAYLSVIRSKETFISQIDDEIKRLTALKKQNTNLVGNLKERLLNAVKMFGTIEVGFNKFSIRKSTQVNVDDINALPKMYKTIKVTESADKILIGKELKLGVEIEGCSLIENENLKIN